MGTIFWGIGSIKGIGEDTADQIINEVENNGVFLDLQNFLDRCVFKGSKVKKTAVEGLIAAGAFDELYEIDGNKEKRNELMLQYRAIKKVKVSNPDRDRYTSESINKAWYWKKIQKELTGLSFINYEKIAEDLKLGNNFLTIRELNNRQQYGI